MDRSVIVRWLAEGVTPADIYTVALEIEQKNKEQELSQAMEDIIDGYSNYYKILTGETLSAELANKLRERLTSFVQVKPAIPTKEREQRKAGTSDEDRAFAEALQKLLRNAF